jgi:anthranilate/para-aminobenzoate synthase component I
MAVIDARFNVVPELSEFSPLDLAARAYAQQKMRDQMVFFDSARAQESVGERRDGHPGGSAISILAVEPSLHLCGNIFNPNDFTHLQRSVLALSAEYLAGTPCDDGLPGPIVAGAVEYNGEFQFGVYHKVLVYRHREKCWYAMGSIGENTLNFPWWTDLLRAQSPPEIPMGPLHFSASSSKEVFCDWVRRAQDYIRSGDIYQVNLSHRLQAEWPQADPWKLYEALRHYSPAPYAAFLRQKGRSILSSSPELFLQFSGRSIRTRPIKGTRPRMAEVYADECNAFDLLTCPKEVAELVMITDLERSDLGQVCEWGSVEVRELLKLERHEQVFHLVSTVEGRLRETIDHVTALRACFPGGSITGAPKKRAREIIAELEPTERGLYTGASGWFGASGESVFNILIRTVVVEEGDADRPALAHFHVGAGVVADSSPESEWQETWDKAAGILLAAERIQPEAGGC